MTYIILIVTLLWSAETPAQQAQQKQEIPSVTNFKELTTPLKLSSFKGVKFKRKLKIAILDNGFNGHDKQIGVSLPRETFYEKYSKDKPKRTADDMNLGTSYHGTLMAQTVAGIIRESGVHDDYELYLYLTYGYTKLADAIEEISAGNFDLVLYSQVWEYGGNGDGKGFINTLVNKALAANTVWVNAAGNFGRSMKTNKIDGKLEGQHEYVVFSGSDAKGVQIVCTPAKGSTTCPLRLTLAWNDFKDDAETGTDKDLDLYLEKSGGERVAAGVKIQALQKQDSNRYSLFPRELIEKDIPAGNYLARVEVMSKNFSTSQDWLRITASGLGVKVKNPTTGETILPPADLHGVIVVGANDDEESGASKKFEKPDVKLKSSVRLSDGTNPRSSSLAAAIAVGVLAVHLGTMEEKTPEAIQSKLLELKGKAPKVAKKKAPLEPKVVKTKSTRPPIVDEEPVKKAETVRRPVIKTTPKKGPAVIAQKKAEVPGPRSRKQEPVPKRSPPALATATRTAQTCLPRTQIPTATGEVRRILSEKGVVAVLFRGRPAILVTYNFPARMSVPIKSGQRIFAGPARIAVADMKQPKVPGLGFYEVITTLWGYRACGGT